MDRGSRRPKSIGARCRHSVFFELVEEGTCKIEASATGIWQRTLYLPYNNSYFYVATNKQPVSAAVVVVVVVGAGVVLRCC